MPGILAYSQLLDIITLYKDGKEVEFAACINSVGKYDLLELVVMLPMETTLEPDEAIGLLQKYL